MNKVGEVGSEVATHNQTQDLWRYRHVFRRCSRGPWVSDGERVLKQAVRAGPCNAGKKGIRGWRVEGGKTIRSEGRPKGGGKAGGFAVSHKDGTEGLHGRMDMGLKPGELQGFPEEPGGPLLPVGWAVELSWASS